MVEIHRLRRCPRASAPSSRTPLKAGLPTLALLAVGSLALSCAPDGVGTSSSSVSEITVAAAANLANAFRQVGGQFESRTGIGVVFSFGSTASLAQQIENGAPFDVYAAADVEHVDALIAKGFLLADTRAVYARGRLVLWILDSASGTVRRLDDLTQAEVKFIAVAKPNIAPYGRATLEVLQSLGLWQALEPKVVYAQNVLMAKQFVDSGNADAAFTALSVVIDQPGRWIEIDYGLHRPIDQAFGVVRRSQYQSEARQFTQFVLGAEGQSLLQQFGYQTAWGPRGALQAWAISLRGAHSSLRIGGF